MSQIDTDFDDLLRAGKIGAVAARLAQINLARVPRERRQQLAKICRRAGLIEKGLRLLHPVVRHPLPQDAPATPGELCEYAVLLSRNGSVTEALSVLAMVNASVVAEAYLYTGFCHVSNWDYSEAAADFARFLETGPDPYSWLITTVNLAASYIAIERFEPAQELLSAAIVAAQTSGAQRLAGNCYELLAQIFIHSGKFGEARKTLRAGLEIFDGGQSYDRLLLDKWTSYMAARELNSIDPLVEFRRKAVELNHWASVREADYLQLKIYFDQSGFDHLYFGSPQPAYRSRAVRLLHAVPSPFYDWGRQGGVLLDLKDGRCVGREGLKAGRKLHQVFSALASDLYEPGNTGKLFGLLYPGEHFDVNSSPLRVRQAVRRARQWLESNQLPVQINHERTGYRMMIDGNFQFRLSYDAQPAAPTLQQWNLLRQAFSSGRLFSVTDAMERLRISSSSFHRLAADALQRGELTKSGRGKATRYKVAG